MKSIFSYVVKKNFTTKNPLLSQILKDENFVKRHIGPNEVEVKEMLKAVGVKSFEQLMDQTLPNQIKLKDSEFNQFTSILKEPISEQEGLKYIEGIANLNLNFKNYIGAGYHPTFVPPVILRNVTENPGWYTSYTPYQSEISQGRLESLLNFQTLIAELTGLPCANASLLDEATAAAEGMYLAFSHHNNKRKEFFLLEDTFPYVKDLIYTKAHYLGVKVIEGNLKKLESLDLSLLCGALIQNPSNLGKVSDHTEIVKKLKEKEVISIVSADILSLLIVKSPGQMGFDVCVGSAQRFGVPMMNGGPHAGYMAVTDELKRKMPGRVVGVSKDSSGNPAYRLSLQTREQHIKREKATSNICTAQALLANMASFFAIFHGKEGLVSIANRVCLFATLFSRALNEIGYKTNPKSALPFFIGSIIASKPKFPLINSILASVLRSVICNNGARMYCVKISASKQETGWFLFIIFG